jgi:hypothetical protein
VAIWYIFPLFGACTKKNLATLKLISIVVKELPSFFAEICGKKSFLKLPPYTPAKFNLTTHSNSLVTFPLDHSVGALWKNL